MLNDGLPARLADRDVEERGDAPDLTFHVALEIREMDEPDVGQLADPPPASNVLPEWPEGMSVASHPVAPVLVNIVRRRLDGRTDSARGVGQSCVAGSSAVGRRVV